MIRSQLKQKLQKNMRLEKPYLYPAPFTFNPLWNNAIQLELQAAKAYDSEKKYDPKKTVEIAEKIGETLSQVTEQIVHCKPLRSIIT